MGSAFIGDMFQNQDQILGPDSTFDNSQPNTQGYQMPQMGFGMPAEPQMRFGLDPAFNSMQPGQQQQQPQPQVPPMPQQQSGNQQYFQQMRQNLDGLSEAFKQFEQIQMPGGQYSGGGMSNMGRGGK